MNRFVAFLRGINVGKHVVVKEQLTEIFMALGFQNVSTYRQSGNVIFKANTSIPDEIKTKIENKFYEALGYRVDVFIRTFPQLESIITLNPFKDQIAEGASYLVTFLPSAPTMLNLQLPITIPNSHARILKHQGSEVYSTTHGGGEGALPNAFLESMLKVKTTTRNMNTIKGIVEKYFSAV
jgi:uncharacterized protein (DUF1697 family)